MAKSKKRKQKERKYRLFYLMLLLLITALSLSVSSYAWFTTNRLARVDLLNVNVRAQGGIEVSTDGINFKGAINVNDIVSARNTYPTSLNQIPKTLEPVSTVGNVSNGLINMFYGKVENNLNGDYILTSQKNVEKEGFDENSDGKFIAFDLFFKTSENTRLYLTPQSVITYAGDYSVGIENAMRVAFVYEGNTFTGNSTANIQTMMTNNSSDVYIWEPNYNKHTSSGVANAKNTYGININEDSSYVPYDGVKNEVSTSLGIKASSAKASLYPTLFETVNISYYTKTDFSENVEIFSLNRGITKIRIYMWIEGQDVDCENDASVGNISLNLQFSKNPN